VLELVERSKELFPALEPAHCTEVLHRALPVLAAEPAGHAVLVH
jgi:hypothetical protein